MLKVPFANQKYRTVSFSAIERSKSNSIVLLLKHSSNQVVVHHSIL